MQPVLHLLITIDTGKAFNYFLKTSTRVIDFNTGSLKWCGRWSYLLRYMLWW